MKKLIFIISAIIGLFMFLAYKYKKPTAQTRPSKLKNASHITKKSTPNSSPKVSKKKNQPKQLTKREGAIMELFTEDVQGKSLHMKDVKKNFPKVTVRTLRRDMDKLQAKGMVEKIGHTKSTRYRKL